MLLKLIKPWKHEFYSRIVETTVNLKHDRLRSRTIQPLFPIIVQYFHAAEVTIADMIKGKGSVTMFVFSNQLVDKGSPRVAGKQHSHQLTSLRLQTCSRSIMAAPAMAG